ncbi:phosphatase 2C-like domain-containing protein [Cristinia sonorae]|uniref:Phosphatase 2C-like domain-containing protein n=1 Tax=Cristinia sonorae TaxID=1940300 RepID=A0A8K0XRJ7_9AGAR|nr:phosphatase 2C-like domain-containing protein [Cristinia sonorae]
MALSLLRSHLSRSPTRSKNHTLTRNYHEYVRFATPGGSGRIPLHNPKIIGIVTSRGDRPYQEDFYSYSALSINPEELRVSLRRAHHVDWDYTSLPPAIARQVLFVGIYDGHGGSAVSQFLRQELHGMFESVNKSHVPELYAWTKELDGYFKRFNGGLLAPWIQPDNKAAEAEMDLSARATLSFFEVDKTLHLESSAQECGATASVVLLQSIDDPAIPFFASKRLSLTVAHVGDTRVLLTATHDGKVIPMTEHHHPDARSEAIRLRRMMGSGLITDSFGEVRWMGALANTRSLGDLKYKPLGVTPEPEVRTMLLEGQSYSHITMVSDGISHVVSDEEISDLARRAHTPLDAARRILSFAQQMGSEDNVTALVIPLSGWGKMTGEDKTRELREYRSTYMEGSERQRRM